MKTTYAIKNTENKNLYWSNTDGWVNKDFDLFTLEESKELNLPINGTWINHIQKDSMTNEQAIKEIYKLIHPDTTPPAEEVSDGGILDMVFQIVQPIVEGEHTHN